LPQPRSSRTLAAITRAVGGEVCSIMMPANVLMAVSVYDRASDSMCPRGYALANAGHDTRALQAWLGHKNIQHTVRYTELSPERFRDFWKD
jgi:hypothetical protein